MKPLLIASLLAALAAVTACNATSADATAAAASATKSFDINKILGGITDKPSAEAAKGPLESAVASLKGMLGTDSAAGGAPAEASGGMKKVSADVLATFGVTGDTMGMITGLLGNPAVTAVIGPVLNQLKGMIGM